MNLSLCDARGKINLDKFSFHCSTSIYSIRLPLTGEVRTIYAWEAGGMHCINTHLSEHK